MSEPPRFLLDENLSPEIVLGVRRRDGSVDIVHVGESGAPGRGTLDPEVLLYCERERRALITNNRKSMLGHLVDFAADGRHHWGIFQVRDGVAVGDLISVT